MSQSIESISRLLREDIGTKHDAEQCMNVVITHLQDALRESAQLSQLTNAGNLHHLLDEASRYAGDIQYGYLNDYENSARELVHRLRQ